MDWSSTWRPHTATNGSRTSAGSGGNGMRPRPTPSVEATGRTSWKNQFPNRSAVSPTG